MRQIYLQKQFYQLARKNIARPSEAAQHRERYLKAWEALRQTGMSGQAASEAIGISRATLYRWQARLKAEGWKGLEQRSRRPKHVRKKQWCREVIEGVRSLRCLYPGWGKEKIKVLLAEDGLECSVSTVGRIIGYLKRQNALPESSYKKRWKPKRRQKRPYAIRKPKGYSISKPGDIIQIDTLDIHPFPNVHFKHFTARDVISRWDVIEVYSKASSRQASQFLVSLIKRLPFKPRAIQVDGGSEFMAEFEQTCANLGIQLFVLPPRSPKLNGRVERAHRTHLDEFYAFYAPEGDLEQLNQELRKWEWIYNNIRPHRALDNLTPRKYIERYYPDLISNSSHMY
jgi:transposase InsO family protein